MTNKLLGYAAAATAGVIILCVGGLAILGGATAVAACSTAKVSAPVSTSVSGGSDPVPVQAVHPRDPLEPLPATSAFTAIVTPHATWSPTQVDNAAIIATVGAHNSIPARGWIIAVATAMQESGLRNLGNLGAHNDHDSLGLFQQRPSQGWGTPAQILNPTHASTKFYTKLRTITGWQTMPLTEAAQAVQHSAFPDAYAKWEPDATQFLTTITGTVDLDTANDCTAADIPAGFALPPDTPPAIVTAITWAFEQLGTPYHLDGDCTAAHSGNPAHECDCSSLTQQAYRAAGITLPRTADEQSRHGQLITNPQHLKPGDLIFIPGATPGTRTHPGHVGMYIGNNLIIEAPTTGQNVKIVHDSGTWTTQQVAIRREIE